MVRTSVHNGSMSPTSAGGCGRSGGHAQQADPSCRRRPRCRGRCHRHHLRLDRRLGTHALDDGEKRHRQVRPLPVVRLAGSETMGE